MQDRYMVDRTSNLRVAEREVYRGSDGRFFTVEPGETYLQKVTQVYGGDGLIVLVNWNRLDVHKLDENGKIPWGEPHPVIHTDCIGVGNPNRFLDSQGWADIPEANEALQALGVL